MGIEFLHPRERRDHGQSFLPRSRVVLDETGSPEKITYFKPGGKAGRPAGGQDMARASGKVTDGSSGSVTQKKSSGGRDLPAKQSKVFLTHL
tara:strand:- start:7 stop:282 length:276 start_codon:yes stop_codon:yes gene_type:complete